MKWIKMNKYERKKAVLGKRSSLFSHSLYKSPVVKASPCHIWIKTSQWIWKFSTFPTFVKSISVHILSINVTDAICSHMFISYKMDLCRWKWKNKIQIVRACLLDPTLLALDIHQVAAALQQFCQAGVSLFQPHELGVHPEKKNSQIKKFREHTQKQTAMQMICFDSFYHLAKSVSKSWACNASTNNDYIRAFAWIWFACSVFWALHWRIYALLLSF